MPNIKSAKKRVIVTDTKTEQNKMFKTAYKTAVKKFEAAVVAGDKTAAQAAYAIALKKIEGAAKRGIIHSNTASRKQSRYTKMLNAM